MIILHFVNYCLLKCDWQLLDQNAHQGNAVMLQLLFLMTSTAQTLDDCVNKCVMVFAINKVNRACQIEPPSSNLIYAEWQEKCVGTIRQLCATKCNV